MANNRKPRKRYNSDARKCNVPMHAETRSAVALDMHLSVESMIAAPCYETHYQLSNMLSAMASAIDFSSKTKLSVSAHPDAVAVMSGFHALIAIEKRFDRLGQWGLSGDEAQTLRKAIGGLDEALKRIPYNVLQAGIARVTQIRTLHAAMAAAEEAAA